MAKIKKIVLKNNIIIFLRFILFIFTAFLFIINLTATELFFLFLTIVSIFLLEKESNKTKFSVTDQSNNNFLKIKKTNGDIPTEIIEKTKNELFEFHINDDYAKSGSLIAFDLIKSKSPCLFSKKAKLWGAPFWKQNISIEENIKLIVPSFILFCNLCNNLKLDGYLITLPGQEYGKNIETFSKAFNQVLIFLSNFNLDGKNSMEEKIDDPKWVFEFSKITFFITTFGPFYPKNHSRFAYGLDDCFILLQPEISFAIKNLPNLIAKTNWVSPLTIRDKIRVSFKKANQEYKVRETTHYPMAYEMIKPLSNDDSIIKWWDTRSAFESGTMINNLS